jgi:hypothetical protein
MSQRVRGGANRRSRPRASLTPSNRAVTFHTKAMVATTYTKQAKGEFCTAKAQSAYAMALKERVNPQKGQG